MDPKDVIACEEQNPQHSSSSRAVLNLSSHAMTSSMIYYSTNARKNEIYLLSYQRSFWMVEDTQGLGRHPKVRCTMSKMCFSQRLLSFIGLPTRYDLSHTILFLAYGNER